MADPGRMSRVPHLLRSSPVRLAVGLVILFSVVNLLSLGLAWLKIRSNVEAQIAANLEQQIAGFRVTRDPRTLATLVEAEAAAIDPANRILVFVAPDGVSHGNARAEIRGREISLAQREAGRPLSPDGYEYRTRAMARGMLIVAESRRALRDTEEIFVAVLIFSILPTVLISLGAGTWLAVASARRVGRIETALRRLEAGDLAMAVEHLSAAIDHAPDFAEAWHLRSIAFFRQERFGLALRDIERVIALEPRHFNAIFGLGVLLDELGKPALAREALLRAQAIHPHHEEIGTVLERVSGELGGATL